AILRPPRQGVRRDDSNGVRGGPMVGVLNARNPRGIAMACLVVSWLGATAAWACFNDADCPQAAGGGCVTYWCSQPGQPGSTGCSPSFRERFSPCDDGNVCTVGDSCDGI